MSDSDRIAELLGTWYEGGGGIDPVGSDRRSATLRPRLPLPVAAEALAMPADHGLRLDHNEVLFPIREQTVHEDPEHAVAVVDARAFHAALQHVDLLAQVQERAARDLR